ncbi:hypothetical protein GCM10009578_065680 [Streptomyces rhizosphaericus]
MASRRQIESCVGDGYSGRPDRPRDARRYPERSRLCQEPGEVCELTATNPAYTRRLLTEATTLLSPLTRHGPTSGFPRSALLHGIHLARAHLLARDSESTATTLLQLADHVPNVQSIRCRNLLRRIRRSAGTRIRAADSTRALTAVDRALSVS